MPRERPDRQLMGRGEQQSGSSLAARSRSHQISVPSATHAKRLLRLGRSMPVTVKAEHAVGPLHDGNASVFVD